ncbi:HEAT repeat domain-containing protein [Nocardioides sp. Root151]|uniref:HEAT repeat domain-containing protein n=1 Tax=Nocardioides sp. Root151 TaxID=1736475 RepID=UPI0019107A54|nr:HEAT repeat domain-containing protein [Nocardioides sp. Root151]
MVNDFTRGLAMMRKRDAQVREDGFGLVRCVAADHVAELSGAYAAESDHGLRCWLLELLGDARSPEALPVFAGALTSPDESIRYWSEKGLEKLDTKEARRLLWEHRHRHA